MIWLDRLIFDTKISIIFLAFTLSTSVLIYFWTALLPKWRNGFLVITAGFATLLIWANAIYFRFFGSLIKVEALTIASQATGVTDSILSLMRLSDIFLFFDIFLFLGLRFFLKDKKPKRDKLTSLKMILAVLFLSFSVIFSILFSDFRSGRLADLLYRNYDVNLIGLRYGVLGAHGLNSYRFIKNSFKRLDEKERQEVIEWVKKNATQEEEENEFSGVATSKNVYLIQFESLQSFVVNKKFEGQEITPNLNRIIKDGYYFPNGESVIGGGRTSDSDFASNTSIYPLRDEATFVQYGRHNFTSLPKALSSAGYTTNAFHAYRRDFWNRGVAFSSLGYDHFFAADEYSEGTNIIMGLNDKDFYLESLEKIKNIKSPSFNYLISLSSHFPFDMAPEHQYLNGDVKKYDYRTYHYYQAIHYADSALGEFIDGLKASGGYENSVIIIYGDHDAKIGDPDDPLTQKTLGTDFDSGDLKKIPFVYKIPGPSGGVVSEKKTTQLDLMPTILNMLNVKTSFPIFGSDVFGSKEGYSRKEIEQKIYYSEMLIRFNVFDVFY
ncbi:MAG: LTA synthase family protein [Patescibacteria group bacterium]|nr:LTA synthase family protein [Patescibacteria group bacterium]